MKESKINMMRTRLLHNPPNVGLKWMRIALLLPIFWIVTGQFVSGQAAVQGFLPNKPSFATGSAIKFWGDFIYDNPAVSYNCDSMVWRNTATNVRYSFYPDSAGVSGDPNYLGNNTGVKDTVYWVIDPILPCGTYTVKFNDDEDCDNIPPFLAPPDWGNWNDSVVVNITDSAIITYPNGGVYCLNGTNPAPPTIIGDQGTFTETTSNGILGNSTTGALILHSGTVGLSTIRFVTGGVGLTCKDTAFFNIQVDSLRPQTLSYGATSFCQGAPTINVQAPFDATGGTFSCVPTTTALNTGTGAFDLSVAPSGGYAITFTPAPGSCENQHSVSIQVDSLSAATYNYAPVYCVGSSANGPSSITFLPPGGFFREVGGTNLVFLDSITGEIDLDNTPAALQYVVEYAVTGGCVSLTKDTFEVRTAANANFSIQSNVCSNQDSIVATGFIPGGSFICTGGAIQFFPPSSAGIVDVGNSTVGGPFTIHYFVNDPVCPDTVQRHITISPAPSAVINYADSTYCLKDVDPAPFFVSGSTGGTFTILPTGSIVDSTGIVDLTATGPGSYTIRYAVTTSGCSNAMLVDSFDILPMPVTNFDLFDTVLCQGSGNHLIDLISSAGGASSTFSMTNAQFIPFPGAIVTNNSINSDILPAGGPYRIVRKVDDGACKDSLVDFVRILPEEDPTFIYAPDEYCQSERDPSPLITGSGGGTFMEINTTGLSIDDSTGLIQVSTSSPGLHTVQYTTGGPCSRSSTFDVLITSATSPDFGYLLNTYCETSTDTVLPNSVPDPPAYYHFTVSSPNLVLLDSMTGALDIFASDTGTYNVTLYLDSTAGNCVTEKSILIEILAYDDDSINFLDPVCKTDSFLQIFYDTTKSGVFFAPSGLVWENRATGLVAVYATLPGTYQIRYEITGICAERFGKDLTVEVPTYPNFDFPLGQKEFCRSDGSTIAIPDNPGGVFSWAPVPPGPNVLMIDSTSGNVNLSGSNSGTYDVTYRTATSCEGDTTKRIIIFPNPVNPRIDLTPGDSICRGQSVEIEGSGSSYFKIKVNGVEATTLATLQLDTLDSTGIIEVVYITQQLCKDSLDTLITVLSNPDGIPIVNSPTISGNEDINFDMTTDVDNTSFNWTLAGIGMVTFSNTDDSIPPLNIGDRGPISVTPTLSNGFEPAQAHFYITPQAYGCFGETDTVIIKINPNNQPIFIPEVFTPNGDLKNDTWLIQWNNDINPDNYRMLIHNRSGGEVESFDRLRDDWDGGSLPDGVYWWQLLEGDNLVFKGAVTIRRR